MNYKELLENTYRQVGLGLSKKAQDKAKSRDAIEIVSKYTKIFLFLKNIESIYKKYKRTRFLSIEKNKYNRPFSGIKFFSDTESRWFTLKELLDNFELLYTMAEESCKMHIWLETTGNLPNKCRILDISILLNDDKMTFSCRAYYKLDYDPSQYGNWGWLDCLRSSRLLSGVNSYIFDEDKDILLIYIEDYMFVKEYCFPPK